MIALLDRVIFIVGMFKIFIIKYKKTNKTDVQLRELLLGECPHKCHMSGDRNFPEGP